MDPRALNRKVTIQHLASGQDALGQPAQGWVPLATVWANIRLVSGVEAIKAGLETSAVKASLRVRRRADVTSAMRVVAGTTVYQIKAVLPDETGKDTMDLACEVLA